MPTSDSTFLINSNKMSTLSHNRRKIPTPLFELLFNTETIIVKILTELAKNQINALCLVILQWFVLIFICQLKFITKIRLIFTLFETYIAEQYVITTIT